MATLSMRRPTWCIAGLFLSVIATSATAVEGEQEMRYLFAGMLQERGKLKSWSCTITGLDPENHSFDMKLLAKGESIRFSRTQHLPAFNGKATRRVNEKDIPIKGDKVIHIPARDEVIHVCDNKQTIVSWNVTNRVCSISNSTPFERQLLRLWDPRMACLVLDPQDTDYQKALNGRLKAWQDDSTIEHKGALWTITSTRSDEWQDIRLSLTVDTEHGFTPVLYRGDTLYKPNSKFPGKVEVYYEATAEWKQIGGVWVPIHHHHVTGDGKVVREYKISWDWVNKDVDDKEFTLDALDVPDDVPKVHFDDRGQQIRKDTSLPPAKPIRRRNRSWLKWAGYALGFALIALALLRYCLRKKPNNPAG